MSKFDRVEDYLASLRVPQVDGLHPCYCAYFHCFNLGDYYEAHDILEHIWLRSQGREYLYYKALIQLAGAYVHLKKNFTFPQHPKHRNRMRPAARLFHSAASYLASYSPAYQELYIPPVIELCGTQEADIRQSNYLDNPWHPDKLPRLEPEFLKNSTPAT